MEELKNFLNIEPSDTQYDTILTQLLDIAKKYVQSYIGTISIADRTYRFLDNYGATLFFIPETPVNGITSVTADGETVTEYSYSSDGMVLLANPTYAKVLNITANTGSADTELPTAIIYMIVQFIFNRVSKNNYVLPANAEKSAPELNIPAFINKLLDAYVS